MECKINHNKSTTERWANTVSKSPAPKMSQDNRTMALSSPALCPLDDPKNGLKGNTQVHLFVLGFRTRVRGRERGQLFKARMTLFSLALMSAIFFEAIYSVYLINHWAYEDKCDVSVVRRRRDITGGRTISRSFRCNQLHFLRSGFEEVFVQWADMFLQGHITLFFPFLSLVLVNGYTQIDRHQKCRWKDAQMEKQEWAQEAKRSEGENVFPLRLL